jgi:S-methylmethionine-dependent homocysteine/selenocysteine methylase
MAELAVQAVAEVGLPVFLGIANATTKGTMEYADSTDQLVEALGEHGPDAILTMCSRPDGISATLPNLRNSFDRPIGGYSNLTRIQNRYPPQTYAQTARGWLDAGAQIIGGCCGSTPDHIAALRALIDESPGRM